MKNYTQVYVKNSFEAAETYCKAFGAEVTREFKNPENTAYEHCEFAIFPKYQLRYGEWHRITSYGARLPWKRLVKELHEKGVYEVYVD